MEVEVIARLTEINREFYSRQAENFAETRRRIQPGVARILARLPDAVGENWLDLGCGSAWLALEWLRAGRKSAYLGLDFSRELLAEAQAELARRYPEGTAGAVFREADFSSPGWDAGLAPGWFRGGLSFAVLHHLAGAVQRVAFLRRAARLLQPGGLLWFSVWQFQNSPRLVARQVDWAKAGLDAADLEPGDTLLDWRKTADGQPALRYVHRFEPGEAAALAEQAGLRVVERFESDGEGGRLGLYLGCVRN
jgi:SAM-dependent methyltransferase